MSTRLLLVISSEPEGPSVRHRWRTFAADLERVGIVAVLGFGIALLSVFIHINRLAFEVAVGLVLLAALGLTRLVIGLRKY